MSYTILLVSTFSLVLSACLAQDTIPDKTCLNNSTETKDYLVTCKCLAGYVGRYCQYACPNGLFGIDCLRRCTCVNGASCNNVNGSCTCPAGFRGESCEIDIDECSTPGICKNGATCGNEPGTYSCKCTEGWTGRHCDTDINECDLNKKLCLNGGLCFNTQGSYTCDCVGFQGAHCETICPKDRYGLQCGYNCSKCSTNATCDNIFGNCKCIDGYMGDRCDYDISAEGIPYSFFHHNRQVFPFNDAKLFCKNTGKRLIETIPRKVAEEINRFVASDDYPRRYLNLWLDSCRKRKKKCSVYGFDKDHPDSLGLKANKKKKNHINFYAVLCGPGEDKICSANRSLQAGIFVIKDNYFTYQPLARGSAMTAASQSQAIDMCSRNGGDILHFYPRTCATHVLSPQASPYTRDSDQSQIPRAVICQRPVQICNFFTKMQVPRGHDFRRMVTYKEANELCTSEPQFHLRLAEKNQPTEVCMDELLQRMQDLFQMNQKPQVWYHGMSDVRGKRAVVCWVEHFDEFIIDNAPLIGDPPVIHNAPLIGDPPVIHNAHLIGDPPVIHNAHLIGDPPVIHNAPLIGDPPVIRDPPVIHFQP